MGLGRAVGARTILVRTGHGAEELDKAGTDADAVVDDLAAAVSLIGSEVRATGVDA